MTDLTALILAGDTSRRHTGDDALADVGGSPMVQYVFDALAPLAREVLIATGSTLGLYAIRARAVMHAIPDEGPLAGLDAGLAEADTAWLLAAALDMPRLTPEVLRPLLSAASGDVDAVISREPDGAVQPLCGLWRVATVAPVVREQIARGDLAMDALLGRIRVETVALDERAMRPLRLPRKRDLPG